MVLSWQSLVGSDNCRHRQGETKTPYLQTKLGWVIKTKWLATYFPPFSLFPEINFWTKNLIEAVLQSCNSFSTLLVIKGKVTGLSSKSRILNNWQKLLDFLAVKILFRKFIHFFTPQYRMISFFKLQLLSVLYPSRNLVSCFIPIIRLYQWRIHEVTMVTSHSPKKIERKLYHV